MRRLFVVFGIILVTLVACGPTPSQMRNAKIAFIGDSVFAWLDGSGKSIPQQTSEILGQPIASFAVSGAQADYDLPITGAIGFDIRQQLRRDDWDLVVVNGGANDVYFECLCLQCQAVVDRLISADGQRGTIPTLLRNTKANANQVLYAGYHRTGGLGGPYDRCADELDTIESRIAKLAASTPGISFADMRGVFPTRDATYYDIDQIHPSAKGAGAYAAALTKVIRGGR